MIDSVVREHARAQRRPMLEDSSELGPLLEHNRATQHIRPYPLPKTPTLSSLVVLQTTFTLGLQTNEWGPVSPPPPPLSTISPEIMCNLTKYHSVMLERGRAEQRPYAQLVRNTNYKWTLLRGIHYLSSFRLWI